MIKREELFMEYLYDIIDTTRDMFTECDDGVFDALLKKRSKEVTKIYDLFMRSST